MRRLALLVLLLPGLALARSFHLKFREVPLSGPVAIAETSLPDLVQARKALRVRAVKNGLVPLDWTSRRTLRSLGRQGKLDASPVEPAHLTSQLDRKPQRILRNGGMVVFDHADATPPYAHYWYLEDGHWKLDPLATQTPYREPKSGDPHTLNHAISLAEAATGLTGQGPLHVTIRTTLGDLHCTLAEREAPRTVANFVGLARGLRASKSGTRHDKPQQGTWEKQPFYQGLTFHRVIPEFMIQGGDPEGDGEGGPGYEFHDEFTPALRYDGPGVMGMANEGPNSNGSQFFVTEQATPWLDDRYSIFGKCQDVQVIRAIARVPKTPQDASRPATPVQILGIDFSRAKLP